MPHWQFPPSHLFSREGSEFAIQIIRESGSFADSVQKLRTIYPENTTSEITAVLNQAQMALVSGNRITSAIVFGGRIDVPLPEVEWLGRGETFLFGSVDYTDPNSGQRKKRWFQVKTDRSLDPNTVLESIKQDVLRHVTDSPDFPTDGTDDVIIAGLIIEYVFTG